jgi:hypothetical protein
MLRSAQLTHRRFRLDREGRRYAILALAVLY